MNLRKTLLLALAAGSLLSTPASAGGDRAALDAMIKRHAEANGVPESLVHRVVMRESRYNPSASHAGNYGLMQIRHGTARGLGYTGSARGLLDAETNLTYAVRYLANAYKVSGGNHGRAVSLYASGYYYAAKRRGMVARLSGPVRPGAEVVNAGVASSNALFTGTAAVIPAAAFASR